MNRFLWRQHLAGAQDPPTRSGRAEEANAAGPTGRCRRWRRPAGLTPSVGVCVFALAALLIGRNSPAQEAVFDSPGQSYSVDGPGYAPGLGGFLASMAPPRPFAFASFYVDYRIRRFSDAHVTYEFGTPDPAGANPLSRLEFPINSTWHGLELGLEAPWYAVRAEWVTPWSDRIDGRLEDRDWLWEYAGLPQSPDFSSLGVADERWIDGHMVDVAFELHLWEDLFGLPISLRPVGGFRWQKFDIMAFDLKQLKGFDQQLYEFVWFLDPLTIAGDAIRFWQEYYQYYAGGQLHVDLPSGALLPRARLTFQGDWAHVRASNFDHHLLREGIFTTRQNTNGNAWHVGVTAEVFLSEMFTVGVEGEYTQIRTAGPHYFINEPLGIDQTWSRGVHVSSEQTAITVFLRLRR